MMRETECFSIYSDISRRISVSGVSNSSRASTFTSSVLPTPVGPTKINDAGLRRGLICTRLRRMAAETAATASCWPMILPFSIVFQIGKLFQLVFLNPAGGDSRPELDHLGDVAFFHLRAKRSGRKLSFPFRSVSKGPRGSPQASHNPARRRRRSLRLLRACRSSRRSFTLSYSSIGLFRSAAQAQDSSSRSIALSGRKRSLIYRSESVTIRLDNRLRNMDAVVLFIVGLNPVEDPYGVRDRRLRNRDGLKTPFQRRVFFNIFAVLRKSRRADHLNLPARKRRLQNIRGIHGAFGIARADKIMHLVDEQDDIALRFHLVEKALDAAFKLAAELRSGNQRRQVEQMDFLFLEGERHVAVRNAEGKALRDGRLADARFADQARIVFRPAAENLNHARNFLFASDDCVNLARLCLGGQVRAVGVQMFALRLMLFLRGFFRIRRSAPAPGTFRPSPGKMFCRNGIVAAPPGINPLSAFSSGSLSSGLSSCSPHSSSRSVPTPLLPSGRP